MSSTHVAPSNGKNRPVATVATAVKTPPGRGSSVLEPSNGGSGPHTRHDTLGSGVGVASLDAADPAATDPEEEPEPVPDRGRAHSIPPAKETPPLDGRAAVKAKKLLQRARVLYGKGEYDKAEVLLKEVVTTYPFMAEANLMLGKIFLIRGSATRDRAMINSARLMFEMARALDPEMREPAVLLELFLHAPPE